MTITNTHSFESGATTTKTEIDIHHENTVMCSRIINSKLWQYLVTNEDKPVTMGYIGNLTKVSDELFIVLAETQLPQDEETEEFMNN